MFLEMDKVTIFGDELIVSPMKINKLGSIELPEETGETDCVVLAQVEKIGEKVNEGFEGDNAINPGDLILYYRHSTKKISFLKEGSTNEEAHYIMIDRDGVFGTVQDH